MHANQGRGRGISRDENNLIKAPGTMSAHKKNFSTEELILNIELQGFKRTHNVGCRQVQLLHSNSCKISYIQDMHHQYNVYMQGRI
jgi:hypothetical protein